MWELLAVTSQSEALQLDIRWREQKQRMEVETNKAHQKYGRRSLFFFFFYWSSWRRNEFSQICHSLRDTSCEHDLLVNSVFGFMSSEGLQAFTQMLRLHIYKDFITFGVILFLSTQNALRDRACCHVPCVQVSAVSSVHKPFFSTCASFHFLLPLMKPVFVFEVQK